MSKGSEGKDRSLRFAEEKSFMKKSDRALITAVFGLVVSLADIAVISICWSIKEAAILTPAAALNANRVLTELRERKKSKVRL